MLLMEEPKGMMGLERGIYWLLIFPLIFDCSSLRWRSGILGSCLQTHERWRSSLKSSYSSSAYHSCLLFPWLELGTSLACPKMRSVAWGHSFSSLSSCSSSSLLQLKSSLDQDQRKIAWGRARYILQRFECICYITRNIDWIQFARLPCRRGSPFGLRRPLSWSWNPENAKYPSVGRMVAR